MRRGSAGGEHGFGLAVTIHCMAMHVPLQADLMVMPVALTAPDLASGVAVMRARARVELSIER